jgi:DNA-binding NarL/FixJ family response regulator
LIIEPGATELLKRCRGRGRTGRQDPVHYSAPRLAEAAATAANRPIEDASTLALMTLTVREHEVLAHALTGATYAAIADALFVSVTTIRSHMQSILRKLGLHSRAQLIARFATAGSAGRLPR